MVRKCANPSCTADFLFFRGGKLFQVDSRDRGPLNTSQQVEHFWLCEKCATSMNIIVDKTGNTRLEPLCVADTTDQSNRSGLHHTWSDLTR